MKILKFYSDTCMPCRQMIPVTERLEEEVEGITVEDVNVEDDAELAKKYDVQGVPTFVLLNSNGEESGRIVGAKPFQPFADEVKLAYGLV